MLSVARKLFAPARSALRALGVDVVRAQPRSAVEHVAWKLSQHNSPIIFDVGANTGQTIEIIRGSLTDPIIHAFEPSPSTFKILERNVGMHPNVRLNAMGVGDANGSLDLIENSCPDMSSFLAPKDAWGEIVARTKVPVTTIDQYCTDNRVRRIDLLKIDTQGYDSRVIRGAETLLARKLIEYITFEVIFDEMYEGIERYDRVFGFLADRGYKPVGFLCQMSRNDALSWADAIFVR